MLVVLEHVCACSITKSMAVLNIEEVEVTNMMSMF